MSYTLIFKSQLESDVINLRNQILATEEFESAADSLAELTKKSKELREKSAELSSVKKHFTAMRTTPQQLFQQLQMQTEAAFNPYLYISHFKDLQSAIQSRMNELKSKDLQSFLPADTSTEQQEQYRYALLTGLVWHFYQNEKKNPHTDHATRQEAVCAAMLKNLEDNQLNETDILVIFDEENIIDSAATETYQNLYERALAQGVLTPVILSALLQQELALLDKEIALLRARLALLADASEETGNTLIDDVTRTADELLTYMRGTACNNTISFDTAKEVVETSKNMIVALKSAIQPGTDATARTNYLAEAGAHATRLSILADETISSDNSRFRTKVILFTAAVLLFVGITALIALTHGGIAPFFAVAMKKSVVLASGKVIQDLTTAGIFTMLTGVFSLSAGITSLIVLADKPNEDKRPLPLNDLAAAGRAAAENPSSQQEAETPLRSFRRN